MKNIIINPIKMSKLNIYKNIDKSDLVEYLSYISIDYRKLINLSKKLKLKIENLGFVNNNNEAVFGILIPKNQFFYITKNNNTFMKYIIIFFSLIIFNNLNSQNFTYSIDRNGANDNADSIIASMGLTPVLIEADFDEVAYYMTYRYKSEGKKSIIVMYEKLPKSDFHLKGVIATFDNLIRYWKMIDPNADAKLILTNEESKWIKYLSGNVKKKAHIFKDENDWIIEVISDF
jgi:hypothetical protein